MVGRHADILGRPAFTTGAEEGLLTSVKATLGQEFPLFQ